MQNSEKRISKISVPRIGVYLPAIFHEAQLICMFQKR